MENRIKISVIIPIFNVEKYINDCLLSVLNQTLNEIEIICINDGTLDNSMQTVNKYAAYDSRIKIINKKNGGLSSARNAGIEKAKGEYILFLDSDDWIVPETLEEIYYIANEYDLDNIYFNADSFFETDEISKREEGYSTYYKRNASYEGIYTGVDLCVNMMRNGDFRPSACIQMPKRKMLIENGIKFYEGIIHEDNLFTIQSLLNEKRVMFTGKSYYKRRMHYNSIVTTVKGVKNAIGYYICIREVEKYITDKKLEEDLYFEIENYLSWIKNKSIDYIKDIDRGEVLEEVKNYANDIVLSFMLHIYREAVYRRELEKKMDNLRCEVVDYQKCNSYKIGRIITYVPRKLKELISNL